MISKIKPEIRLKELTILDVNKTYQKWMNNTEIFKFSKQSYKKHSLKQIKEFVLKKKKSKNEFLYKILIYENKKNNHVGNIKLGPINFENKTADISYFIGEKNYWDRGITTKAIKMIINLAKKKFKLKKLQAGHWEKNIASKKVLLKNKFKLEGVLKSQIQTKKGRINRYLYGLVI
jgi:[ribosomal protein S5]-alanine N-acetyltransferase